MPKVHPNVPVLLGPSEPAESKAIGPQEAAVLTVWRKSLLFNCNGFTVFDSKGNLVFRVDNYASANTSEVVLMDAAGEPLLTVRRKKLSLSDHWLLFDGEESTKPRFSVKRHGNFLHSKTLAHVSACGAAAGERAYEVEGSYYQRSCVIYDDRRRPVAEIKRKEAAGGVAFGTDVFRLVVQPGIDAALAMAIVVVLDQMFQSSGTMSRIKRCDWCNVGSRH